MKVWCSHIPNDDKQMATTSEASAKSNEVVDNLPGGRSPQIEFEPSSWLQTKYVKLQIRDSLESLNLKHTFQILDELNMHN